MSGSSGKTQTQMKQEYWCSSKIYWQILLQAGAGRQAEWYSGPGAAGQSRVQLEIQSSRQLTWTGKGKGKWTGWLMEEVRAGEQGKERMAMNSSDKVEKWLWSKYSGFPWYQRFECQASCILAYCPIKVRDKDKVCDSNVGVFDAIVVPTTNHVPKAMKLPSYNLLQLLWCFPLRL